MHAFNHPITSNFPGLRTLSIIACFAIVFACVSDAHAQRRKSALGEKKTTTEEKKGAAKPGQPNASMQPAARNPLAGRPNQQAKVDEFAPQVVTMEVKREGIQLVATWFPPIIDKDGKKKKKSATTNSPAGEDQEADPGKTVAPFILVHDWTRSRNDLLQLASFLQSKGHAVIVPDLRGHGQSVRVSGMAKPIDHSDFKNAEKASAVGDIDQCKRFLQEKNNEGILNIDLLNVIAVGDSSHIAIAWAIADWSWEPVAGIKQGKDVKSLILFSPTKKFAGSSLKKLAKAPLISGRNSIALPLLVIWGGKSEIAEDCDTFVTSLRKFRPEASEGKSMEAQWQSQNLFHFEAKTQMQGFQLAGNPNAAQIWAFANNFVAQKVMTFKDQCPWQIRGAEAVLKAREAEEE